MTPFQDVDRSHRWRGFTVEHLYKGQLWYICLDNLYDRGSEVVKCGDRRSVITFLRRLKDGK